MAKGEGTISIKCCVNGVSYDGYLNNVLYVPEFNKNLYSTNAATARGLRVIFDNDTIEIVFKESNQIVAQGRKIGYNLCVLNFEVIVPNIAAVSSFKKIHESLGHVNKTRLGKMM